MKSKKNKKVAIVGTGPAGLMAATLLAKAGVSVCIFEKRRSPGFKLLLAGSSGLNISHDDSQSPLWQFYQGDPQHFQRLFEQFSANDWIAFIESLGLRTFLGTSGRHFVEDLTAARLLKCWVEDLEQQGVVFQCGHEFVDFQLCSDGVAVRFDDQPDMVFDALCLCLGGVSWESNPQKIQWPQVLKSKGIMFVDFEAGNCGYEVDWDPDFLNEAEGLPLKNIQLHFSQGVESGELTVTSYGLEGTPVYSLLQAEKVFLDLKPDMSKSGILDKLTSAKKTMSPIRLIKKYLKLCPASLALLYHHGVKAQSLELEETVSLLKKFPVTLLKKRGLEEAISSMGGVCFENCDEFLMLKKFSNVFVAGEMLNWHAPTGGYLIQACVSQGALVARGVMQSIAE